MARTIDEILEEARRGLARIGPLDAARAVDAGALLVDIRPIEQRARDGGVAGALVIDRNVLEWRLDPASPHRIVEAAVRDRRIIVMCNEGYASSLAAATLCELGLDATDLDGGFQGWIAAGLPIAPPT
ncbi:MAG TPA: rhodanese-like domain-containing protein [Acidimicrobiales bacterium]|jgi:rhodanese-related sulfurtransferase|nr:rhodanese-like domain-containing protein [Acidimicrobiales bacterium]